MYQTRSGMRPTRSISAGAGRLYRRPIATMATRANRERTFVQGPGSYSLASPTLGFSLNPINLIKSAVGAVKSIFKNSTVTIPGASGPVSVPTASIPAILRGATIEPGLPAPPPTATQRIEAGIEAIPGGFATLAALGVGAIVLTAVLARRR